jgi:uncharacterized Rossmann fold enzyme
MKSKFKYLYSLDLLYHRIINKLTFESNKVRKYIYLNKNEQAIFNLKDKYKGSRCFLIGMGPSLKIEDLLLIKNEYTFSCNKIFLSFNQLNWMPSFYSVADLLVAENNKIEINRINKNKHIIKLFSKSVKQYFHCQNDIIYIDELGCKKKNSYCFSDNLVKGYYSGTTVSYRMIQQAVYMGFKEIYLLGMDFNFIIPKKKEYNIHKKIKDPILVNGPEVNHFHKDYRKTGEKWTIPKLDIQYKAFQCAKSYCDKNGINVINISRDTKLDVFPRKTLDDVL